MERTHEQSQVSIKEAIKKSWQEGDLRLWKRLKAIWLYQKGYPPEDICTAVDVSRRSIFYWLKRYKSLGIAGLQEGQHPGRPRGLEDEQLERLAEILDSGPVAYGFSSGIPQAWLARPFAGTGLGFAGLDSTKRKIFFPQSNPEVAQSQPWLFPESE